MDQQELPFQLSASDWFEMTKNMSRAQKGMYIDLLLYQHKLGWLPTEKDLIARMLGMEFGGFLATWQRMWYSLKDKNHGLVHFRSVRKIKVADDESIAY